MAAKEIDQNIINKMTEAEAKSQLYSAITIMRKVYTNVPEKKRKIASSYSKEGHMKCVNYLRGFLNIWEGSRGS